MGRLIDVSDLNNQIMLNKDRFGCLSVTISNVFEDIIRDTPTVNDNEINIVALENSVLKDIKAEIRDMYPNYTDEKGYRMIRKSDVLNIIDKHIKSEDNNAEI